MGTPTLENMHIQRKSRTSQREKLDVKVLDSVIRKSDLDGLRKSNFPEPAEKTECPKGYRKDISMVRI